MNEQVNYLVACLFVLFFIVSTKPRMMKPSICLIVLRECGYYEHTVH